MSPEKKRKKNERKPRPEPREPVRTPSDDRWSIDKAAELYQIAGWGAPYFRINEAGHVEARPDPDQEQGIDLYDLARDLEARGIALPLLIRFSNILDDRIRLINECFRKAIKDHEYEGEYRGVYPVKVNQHRHLVEEVVRFGKRWGYGLEAGSKPELLIALALMETSDGLIICNGYKDLQYIESALVAQQFDKTVVLVLERIEELDLIFKAADKTGLTPVIGVRAKLASKGIGQWADSAGEKAKFGLTAAEIVEVVDRLRDRGWLDSLQLLHFHIGSQVSSIIPWKNAIREAAQFFSELTKLGADMKYLDVGGGLAVDYDGSKTDFAASKNYEIQEYAADVVSAIHAVCQRDGIPHPTIITEAGRGIAAHQSMLVFEVLGTNAARYGEAQEPDTDAHPILRELWDTYRNILPKNIQESFHDALQAKDEAQSLFKFGYVGLRERALAEKLFWHCCKKIAQQRKRARFVAEELYEMEAILSTVYYCNFSVFQSAPDTWAIDQLFPIMPIHRLDEEPNVMARLADLTCDSDGIIDHFIDVEEVRPVLPVHRLEGNDSYYLGMFLNGAYQEILGDMHNLFGDTNVVHVRLTEHGYEVSHVIKGDAMHDVLKFVQYDPEVMMEQVRRQAERALGNGRITLPQMKLLLRNYERSMRSYTYLTDED